MPRHDIQRMALFLASRGMLAVHLAQMGDMGVQPPHSLPPPIQLQSVLLPENHMAALKVVLRNESISQDDSPTQSLRKFAMLIK